MSYNGFGSTGSIAPFPNCCCTLTSSGLPPFSDDSSDNSIQGFNAVGQAAMAYDWTLAEEALTEFNKQHETEPSCTNGQAAESHTYGSGPVQYPSTPAVGTEQPYLSMPPPPILTPGQVIMRSTPAIHLYGNQQATDAVETRPSGHASPSKTDPAPAMMPLGSTSDSGS